jgi:hypothetical protein
MEFVRRLVEDVLSVVSDKPSKSHAETEASLGIVVSH